MRLITINWIDEQGENVATRFALEIDAILFEESLDAAGLPHRRAVL